MWWVLYMLYFQIFFFLWLSRVFALDHHGRQKMFPTWIMSLPKIEFPFDASSQQNHISLWSVKIQPFPLVSTCLLCCTCFHFPVSMIKWTLSQIFFRRNANDVAYSFFPHFINNGYILSSISCACICWISWEFQRVASSHVSKWRAQVFLRFGIANLWTGCENWNKRTSK